MPVASWSEVVPQWLALRRTLLVVCRSWPVPIFGPSQMNQSSHSLKIPTVRMVRGLGTPREKKACSLLILLYHSTPYNGVEGLMGRLLSHEKPHSAPKSKENSTQGVI
jgi:hypothetical protein